MVFRILFLVLALVMLGCLLSAVWAKRRNNGFILAALLVAACDVICFLLLGSKSVASARNILTAFYICYAWLFFAVLWTVSVMGKHRLFKWYGFPVFAISVYQTVVMAGGFFGKRALSPSKHIFLGKNWWLAQNARNVSVFFSLNAYRVLSLVNIFIILCVMIVCCIHTIRIFRGKFIVFIAAQLLLAGVEILLAVRLWPVWIICLVANVICVLGLYFIKYYSDQKLRNWSLISFANEMSDGFALYNEYDDLIYMNDLLKKTLSSELLAGFKDKKALDAWVSDTTTVDNIEVLAWEKDGNETYFKVRRTELGVEETGLGTIYIFHDTTESIKQMQVMEEANRELARAAKMKSDFLANMSHELRTPMNAVIGMAEIAMREQLPPHVLDYLTQIQHSGRNLLNIINDILDFSKIEAGKMEIIPEEYEPLSEINDVANVLATRIGDKKLELFVTTDTDIPRVLEGDAMRIRQVLINLANNAIKFTTEGTVHVRIFCERTAEDMVVLTYHVIDTGTGIRKEDMDKLFVSFQQVDSKRNRSVEGTGLGLAISQRLCEAMGGSIGVTSEYGKGSDFYFTIPQKIVDPVSDIAVADASSKHAFCLCDNDRMVDMFTAEMEKLGVDARVIRSLAEFRPTGETDYFFFEEQDYGEEVRSILDENRECRGVILVNFDSEFVPKQANLHVMRRPETTLAMVQVLNDREVEAVSHEEGAFQIDFVAPEARILIVDDNAINITIAEGLLQPLHAKCEEALSGKAALEKIRENQYDLILMDHMMPEMDGVETTQMIRNTIPAAAKTPILAVTANVLEGVKDMFIKAGMDDFVAKPIDVRDLITKVRQWMPAEKILSGEEAKAYLEQAAAAGTAPAANASDEAVVFEGLDCESAIKALGSPALFQKIVQEYYRSGEAKAVGIKAAYESEDWKDYTIRVHALKSSSRQIGAAELGDMAADLEEAGNALDLDRIHDRTDALLESFAELLQRLAPYFVEEERDESSLPAITTEELDRILQDLKVACDDLDMDAMEAAKEELQKYALPEAIRGDMNELFEAIDNIDIDACMEIIQQVEENKAG